MAWVRWSCHPQATCHSWPCPEYQCGFLCLPWMNVEKRSFVGGFYWSSLGNRRTVKGRGRTRVQGWDARIRMPEAGGMDGCWRAGGNNSCETRKPLWPLFRGSPKDFLTAKKKQEKAKVTMNSPTPACTWRATLWLPFRVEFRPTYAG